MKRIKSLKFSKITLIILSLSISAIFFLAVLILFCDKDDSSQKKNNSSLPADNLAFITGSADTMYFDEALFLVRSKQEFYESSYSGYTFQWDSMYDDTHTYEEVVLEESLDFIKEIFILSEYAIKNNFQLTDSDKALIEETITLFKSPENETFLKATNASDDLLRRVYTRMAYYEKTCNHIYETVDFSVNEDDIRQCLVAAVEISPKYFDSPKRTADKIAERVNNGELISEVANIYSAVVTKGNVGKGDMNGNSLETLCLSLTDGQCKVTSVDDTYFVVYCYLSYDEEATAATKNQLITKRKNDAVDAFYKEQLLLCDLSYDEEAYKTINFDKRIYE